MKSLHIIATMFLSLPNANAGQPMASGTIVVIAQTKSRIIIAADSRVGTTENGTIIQSVDDSSCKIAALNGHVVFAAAGLLSDGKQGWTAISEANAAIANTPHARRISGAEGDSVLARWADSMMRNYMEFSGNQLSAYADANSGRLTTGVLAGVEESGRTWIHAVMLNYGKNGSLSYQGYVLTSNDPPCQFDWSSTITLDGASGN